MKNLLFITQFIFLSLFFTQNTQAQNETRLKHFNLSKNWAAQGYDVVAYFSNKAIKGDKNISATYKGVYYAFANKANLDSFKNNPEKYEPQYGGWCAYAMGYSGEKVEIDPSTFKIVDNKLYLFYNAYFNNTKNSWNKDEANYKVKADKNWKNLFK
jgi:YHS domain-containing protein